MRLQLGKHPTNSHGKLRAAMVGHGQLCSMSGERFGLDFVYILRPFAYIICADHDS